MKSVLGYDGSDCARRALARAAEVAGGDEVIVVSVVPVAGPAGHGPAGVKPGDLEAHDEMLQEARQHLDALGCSYHLVETLAGGIGDTADALMDVAREHAADLIVVGTRGHTGLKKLLLGSVSSKLTQEAPCDVLVVR